MHTHIMPICQPNFFFIWSQCNAMTGIAVSSYRTSGPSFYFYMCQFFSGQQVSDFKAKQAVHVTYTSVSLPLIVNGRTKLENGPILFVSTCLFASAICSHGDAMSSR